MNTELLAPAGDIEAGYAAIHYGADAVYLGLPSFSARAEAVNFSEAELDAFVAYAHAQKRKVYVTVNTLVQEAELSRVMETLDVCQRYDVDAVIVQDLGVARLVKQCFPKLALHASTQLAAHNLEGVLALKKMGFSRVVLARELSLSEIKRIQEKSGVEIEVFIHGALCYSYSGLCFFSSFETGRSANRGKCAYPCRGLFELGNKVNHPFSMKDLALEKEVLKLKGVSLKIEGRKKTALYVAAVVDYYRRILDTGRADVGLTDNLKQIFARPWTALYFKNTQKQDVIDPDFVGHRGLKIGVVEKISNRTISFKTARDLAKFDGIQIDLKGQEKPFGFSLQGMKAGNRNSFTARAGQMVELELPAHHPFIQVGDVVYLASSTRVKNAYPYERPKSGAFKKRTFVAVRVWVEKEAVYAESNGRIVSVSGQWDKAQQAEKVSAGALKAFQKTGESAFVVEKFTFDNPQEWFVPVSVFNELRRALLSDLAALHSLPALPRTPLVYKSRKGCHGTKWIVKTDQPACLTGVDLSDMDEICVVLNPDFNWSMIQQWPAEKMRFALPVILRGQMKQIQSLIEQARQKGFKRFEVANVGALSLMPKGCDVTFDSSLYVLNTQAMEQAFECGATRITVSPEDSLVNMRALMAASPRVCVPLYQDVPLFVSANCARPHGCDVCSQKPAVFPMKQKGKKYWLISKNCQTTVIADKAVCFAERIRDFNTGFLRVDFCYRSYTPEQVVQILNQVRKGVCPQNTMSFNLEKGFI